MRLTNTLLKQSLWRMKKAIWQAKSKRVISNTKLKESLVEKDIEVVDAWEVAALPKPDFREIKLVGAGPLQPKEGTISDLNYNEERVCVYNDGNVLIQGLEQAKLLTNTIEPAPEKVLPSQIVNLIDAVSHPKQNRLVRRCIKSSLIFEAEQVKLPVIKDPARPSWVFPREYGICDRRRNHLLCKKLIQLCEMISQLSGNRLSEERYVIDNARFNVPLKWQNQRFLLNLRSDLLVASKSVLSPITHPENYKNWELPDMSPLLPTVSLEKVNFYQYKDDFPMKSGPNGLQVHTAIVHYNGTEVKNIYGEEVNESQILGRSLMKAYAFAVAQARQNHGTESKGQLPVPVTVQMVQTNSQWFHFSVMQLNTFDLHDTSIRNYFWSTPLINLYSFCGYNNGKPELIDYNPEVFKMLLAFYNNVL